jgi:predicted metalloprotease with PDZ domain
VSEASFDAWIKLYRPDEATRSTTISYYAKGAVVAFCLDLLIQARSQGQHSLDDVMRGLFAHYERHGPGQSRELVQELVAAAAGCDLGRELHLLVEGTEDPPLADWLQPFGLVYVPPSAGTEPTLDVAVKVTDGVARLTSVDRGGAGWQMGLSADDEPIAINGERVVGDQLLSMVREELSPGDDVEIHVFRRGLLTSVRGKVGAKAKGTPRIVESPSALRFRAVEADR